VKRRTCQRLAEFRSAYVDGALGNQDRESLLAHLVGCEACRREVEDLRRVRDLLAAVRGGSSAPSELTRRLVSIAGAEATAPLWIRPFRRTRPGALPNARRTLRLRTTAVTIVLGSLVATAGGIGYAAAPVLDLTDIKDPSGRAQTEFASVLTQFPLATDAANAAMVTSATDLTGAATPVVGSPDPAWGRQLGSVEALTVLERAVQTATEVGYVGTQVVIAPRDGSILSTKVAVHFEPGLGSTVTIRPTGDKPSIERLVGKRATSRMIDRELLSLLSRNYALRGATDAEVAGRHATMVEAVRRDLSSGVLARWWVDNETGLLLWSETYDRSGALTLASGFSHVQITSGQDSFLNHLPPSLTTSVTTATLTLSHVDDLSSHGWFCSGELAGLSLVRLRTGAGAEPAVVHMVYSDGVSTVSVFEERGRLTAPSPEARWDNDLQAYVRPGASTSATWQSGDTVFTVVTDGPAALLAQAVQALPHGKTLTPTTIERVHAGWVRIIERIVG
jgi:anti-sigma factor RsiW